jgi:hypothetical protein
MIRKWLSAGLVLVGFLGFVQVAAADGPLFGRFHGGDCPEKVCQPKVETKSVVTRCYDDVCEDFCYPRCSCFSLFGGHGCSDCEGGCPDGKCDKLRTKKILVVKLRKHDECVHTCVPAPVCPAPVCDVPAPVVIPPGR